MSKPAKPSVNAFHFLRYAFESDVEEICRLARTGHCEREGQLLYEPDEIVAPPRRRKGGQEQRKPKSRLRTFADDPRLAKKECNKILAHAHSLQKADTTFWKILEKTSNDLVVPLLRCVREMREAYFAIGQLNPSPILGRLRTAEATASRDKTASERINETIAKVAKPVIARHPKWTANRLATEIRDAANERLKAEGLLAADKPLSAATIRRRLVAQTP
jgi:hypothetical protein